MSLIQHINYLARNLSTLEKAKDLLTPSAIATLEETLKLPLNDIVKDLKKGTSADGKRKLDIVTDGNSNRGPESVHYDRITIESVGGAHKETHTITPTSEADQLQDGIEAAIRAFNDAVPVRGEVRNVDIDLDLPEYGPNSPLWVLRVTDQGSKLTSLSRISLHVSLDSVNYAKLPKLEFTWDKSSSSILLLGTSLEAVTAGIIGAEFAQELAEAAELKAKASEESAELSAADADRSAEASEASRVQSAISAEEARLSAAYAKTEVEEGIVSGVADVTDYATEQAERAEQAFEGVQHSVYISGPEGMYTDTLAGLAAVGEGGKFWVLPNPVDNIIALTLYTKTGGVADRLYTLYNLDYFMIEEGANWETGEL